MAKRFNGEGSIRQRTNGSWEARYTNPITNKQQSVYGKTKQEVQKKLKEKLRELDEVKKEEEYNRNGAINPNKITLNEWFDIYVNRYKKERVKPQTYAQMISQYRVHIKPYIGDNKLRDINVGDITDVVNILNKKELSNYVIKNTISRLKSCFETALEEDIITKNPVKSINTNGLGKSANIRRSLTNDELYWFFRGLTEHSIHDKFLFQLMLTTGIRVGELSALRWKNVDEDFKFITIDSTLTQYYNDKKEYIVEYCTPKTDRIRKIPIKDDVQSLFKQHKTILMEKYHGRKMTLTDEDFIFQKPIKKGMSQEKVQRIIDSIRNYLDKEYGIKLERFTPHYFRHTFATVAIHSDIPSIDIQKIGGWTDGAMLSKVYAHSNEELMTNSINKLNISF